MQDIVFWPKRCQRQNNQLNLHFNLNICGTRFRNEPMCKSQSQSWSRPEMISLSLGLDFWDFQVSVSVSSLDQTRIWSQSQSQSLKSWSRRLLIDIGDPVRQIVSLAPYSQGRCLCLTLALFIFVVLKGCSQQTKQSRPLALNVFFEL